MFKPFLAMQEEEFGNFDRYSRQFVGGSANEKRWRSLAERPSHTAESDALNKNFKPRGFKLDGSAIISALMQATGMVNDHLMSYPRQAELGGSSSRAPKASKRA